MKRPLKIFLVTLSVFAGFVVLLWLGVATYVSLNKREILQKVMLEINQNINGTLTVESMEPSLIRGFPGVAVELRNVLLRDSLFVEHRHNLIKARRVYVAVNSFSLLIGKPDIQSAKFYDGEIYLYTDSGGYRNTMLFRKTDTEETKKPRQKFNRVELQNMKVVYDNRLKRKNFDFSVDRMKCKINYYPSKWKAELDISSTINSLTFRSDKGSFLKGKRLRAELNMEYGHKDHILSIPLQSLMFDKTQLKLGGDFSFGPKSSAFHLKIQARDILYKEVLELLTLKISSKLRRYSIKRAFNVSAVIKGRLKGPNIPLINIFWNVKNNEVNVPGDVVKRCTFIGSFTNEVARGVERKDPNSALAFYGLKGEWRGIAFRSDTLKIMDLKRPVVMGRFNSEFPLSKINAISGSRAFKLNQGTALVNLWYKAPLNSSSKALPFVFGYIKISDGLLNYYPRNIQFKNISGVIQLKGQDLFLNNFSIKTKRNQLRMRGSVSNFVNFYYSNPQRIDFRWYLSGRRMELQEFVFFLGTRKNFGGAYRRNRVGRFFSQLNRVLDEASLHLDVKADEVRYKEFTAHKAHASFHFNQNELRISDVSLQHAGGFLKIRGRADQKPGVNNKFSLNSVLSKVDINRLFYSFSNFGQQSVTSKNIRGLFWAKVNVNGKLNSAGTVIPRSFSGSIDFSLKNAALINFEPLEKVGRFAFPKRNFSNITINQLSNTLEVRGSKIFIPEMTVMTSVLNLIVKGVYGIPTGTNIAMRIPLRNPEKDKYLPDSLRGKRVRKGIVINLTAMDDENGLLKIKLGKKDNEGDENESAIP